MVRYLVNLSELTRCTMVKFGKIGPYGGKNKSSNCNTKL